MARSGFMKDISFVISYDISDDKERYLLERLVSKYAARMHYSVFWGVLSKQDYNKLCAELDKQCLKTGSIVLLQSVDFRKIKTYGDIQNKFADGVFVKI